MKPMIDYLSDTLAGEVCLNMQNLQSAHFVIRQNGQKEWLLFTRDARFTSQGATFEEAKANLLKPSILAKELRLQAADLIAQANALENIKNDCEVHS